MDITTRFGRVIVGSSPAGCAKKFIPNKKYMNMEIPEGWTKVELKEEKVAGLTKEEQI
jgi:hypothetical protein